MDDQSLWKKELSFGRKPNDQTDDDGSTASDEKPTSLWKKELSLQRQPKGEVEGNVTPDTPVEESVVEEPVAEEPAVEEPAVEEPAVEEPAVEEPAVEEPAATEPEVPEETVWKKEVSFAARASSDDQPVEADPVVAEATAAAADVPDTDPEPRQESEVWTKEVSFSRTPEVEAVAAPSADEALAAEEESPVIEHAVAEEPVVADEPVVAEEQISEEVVVAETLASAEVEAEPWNAPPSLPPAPFAETPTAIVSAPTPSVDVHPPVAAADLPRLADEAPKVPFWKKELSLGSKKRGKPDEAPTAIVPVATPADVHPPVAAADLPPLADDAPKAPFWKKELSLGGKKRDKPVKERKQKAPKVKADRGSSKGRIVGLKIGASQLAAACVSNNGSNELLQVAREALAPGIVVGGELRDPDALAEALKDFFARHGLPKKGVRLGIANNRIGVRTFEVAGIDDPKQLANAIRFRAQEALPIPIDQAVLDYQVLGEGVGEDGQPSKRVLLVVAYRELIDRYVDACKKAGITLVGIDLEAFALLRALQAPQEGAGTDATAALVVVAIGHERSTFAVSDGRVCEFTRVLEWGGSALNVAIARAVDAAPSEVEGAKRALALTDEMVPDGLTAEQAKNARDSMRRGIQTFARELVSSLQYYQNQPGSLGIGEIVLTGGTAHLPGLSGELERLIGVHVRVGDPLARMKVSKKVGQPEQIGSLAVAIGLGIED